MYKEKSPQKYFPLRSQSLHGVLSPQNLFPIRPYLFIISGLLPVFPFPLPFSPSSPFFFHRFPFRAFFFPQPQTDDSLPFLLSTVQVNQSHFLFSIFLIFPLLYSYPFSLPHPLPSVILSWYMPRCFPWGYRIQPLRWQPSAWNPTTETGNLSAPAGLSWRISCLPSLIPSCLFPSM